MSNPVFISGNAGSDVRSDCQFQLEIGSAGGIDLIINSKVKSEYGESINTLCRDILSFFDIKHAKVTLTDSGALPFVLAARLESAISLAKGMEKEYLLEMIPEAKFESQRERNRFTRLYLPGNSPKLMLNAGIHGPDGIILDLEDSVAPDKKHEARFLVRNALRQVNFFGCERMVRINQIPAGLDDLPFLVPHNAQVILVPKCESADQMKLLDNRLDELKKKHDVKHEIWFMPIIESALGIEKAFEIATSSKHIVAMAIGLEDYTADLGVPRTNEGSESLFARNRLVNACKAAGIQPIDSVFSDISDMNALLASAKQSKAMGFEGMGCIHPRQVKIIRSGFAPTQSEIEKAGKIMAAWQEANEKGLGVVSLGSKMIDPPVVKRAIKTIELAKSMGLLLSN
jgi:citrate lyase subunit beta / citryl-CoA lyase